jgi:hypothetical protein
MYARLDDELLDHRKVLSAGARLGPNGAAIAIGFYAVLLMYANRHLTDGFIPDEVLAKFSHVRRPRDVADALVFARLLLRVEGGYQIHDFADYNPSAEHVKTRRRAETLRKRAQRAAQNGHERGSA